MEKCDVFLYKINISFFLTKKVFYAIEEENVCNSSKGQQKEKQPGTVKKQDINRREIGNSQSQKKTPIGRSPQLETSSLGLGKKRK